MPEAIATALVNAGWGVTASYVTAYAVTVAAVVGYSDYSRRKASAKARAAANASAKDREVMIRSATAPRRVIYGRDRVSGPIFYMEATGAKKEYLHLCIALAGHECDAIESIYFNERLLPTPDGDGFIQDDPWITPITTEMATHTGTTDGAGSITLPHNALSITAAFTETGVGEQATHEQHTGYSHTPGSNTISGLPASYSVSIGYTYAGGGEPLVRVRKFLGTSTQTADADLVAESAGLWTVDHRARGVCYLYVRLQYHQDVFGSIGVPNISAVVRGKKVLDPRTSTTAWSDNAALCLADWLKSAEGLRAAAAEVPDAEVITAANICDEVIDLDAVPTATQLRYTCNTSITTETSPRDALGELAACMAGRAVWTQGRWLVRAGAHRTPTLTITADMLAGPLQIVPRASRSELFNAVRATHRDDGQDYAEVQAPLVTNAGYEASDGGVQVVRNIDVPTVCDTYRAQRLAKIELERGRQALTVQITCNLAAYDLAPTDTVMLTLSRYGFSAKVMEVIERSLSPEGTIQYTLRETAAGIWDWAFGEATVGDLAPNTILPSVFGLPDALTGLAAVEQAIRMADGTILTQAVISWDASTSPWVVDGGSIEYQSARVDTPWGTGTLPGNATEIILGPLQVGIAYVFRARAVSATGRAGDWAYLSLVAEGIAAAPGDVAGLAYAIKPGQVVVTWTACADADYAATELRVGASWAAGTFLWRGAGTEYQHPRPDNGTYTVWAAHQDTSGTYSATPASLSVTVDDSIDPAAGIDATLLTLDATGFAFIFADASATTATTPGEIDFTASLQNVTGSVTWAATAYNAAGTSLGSVTLTLQTATTCRLTAANFVSYANTRTVRVTATLGALSDTMTVYRGDDGSSTVQTVLTNEAHTLATSAAGVVTYTGSGTIIRTFEGVTELQFVAGTPANGQWTASAAGTSIGVGGATITGLFVTVGDHNSMIADQAKIDYTITGLTTTGAAFTHLVTQSFAKSRAGAAGSNITVQSNAGNVFRLNASGTGYTPSSIVVSRVLGTDVTDPSAAGTVWSVVSGTTTNSLAVLNTTTGAPASFEPAELTTDTLTLRCTVTDSVTGRTYTDDITLFKVRDSISGYLTNDSISLPAAAGGGAVSSYTGATGTFKVIGDSGDITVTGGNPAFSYVSSTGFSTAPTGSINSSGVYTISSGIDPSTAVQVATVTYRATYVDPLGGATKTIDRTFTIAKAAAGAGGGHGLRGSLTLYSSSVSPTINLSGTTWPLDTTSPFGTNDNNALKIVWQALGNSAASFVSDTVSHMRIGDTVTLVNAGGTIAITKYWTGAYWADPGVVISGNLLVGGTISGAVNLNIAGTAQFDGLNSALTVQTDVGTGSKTTAVQANTSGTAAIGVWGKGTAVGSYGIYGESAGASGVGVFGYGANGIMGKATSGGKGVYGVASGASSYAVYGKSDGNTSHGGHFGTGGSGGGASNVALYCDVSNSAHTAFYCDGASTFTGRITSTLAGTAVPLVLPVVTSKPTAIAGGVCLHSTLGLIFSDGTNWYGPSGGIVVV